MMYIFFIIIINLQFIFNSAHSVGHDLAICSLVVIKKHGSVYMWSIQPGSFTRLLSAKLCIELFLVMTIT